MERSLALTSRGPSGFPLPPPGHKDAGDIDTWSLHYGPKAWGHQGTRAPLAIPLQTSQGFPGGAHGFVTNPANGTKVPLPPTIILLVFSFMFSPMTHK